MRAVGTRITFIHGLTHQVDYDTSPLPPWLLKQRFAESEVVRQREEAFSLWQCSMYFTGNGVTVLINPAGLERELTRMYESLEVAI